MILGKLPPTVALPEKYFTARDIFLDCRGPLTIEKSHWGWQVMVLTESHDIATGELGPVVTRPVIVRAGAWIGSRALLYNCEIGQGAVVAAGAVVKSMTVEPYTMVAGNPAVVVERFIDGRWVKVLPVGQAVQLAAAGPKLLEACQAALEDGDAYKLSEAVKRELREAIKAAGGIPWPGNMEDAG